MDVGLVAVDEGMGIVARFLRLVLIAIIVLVFFLGSSLGVLWLLASRTPEFYEKKLPIDREVAKKASDEFLQKTSLLASDLKREGTWYLKITEEEINGWLAVDLPKNHAQSLPRGVSDPRIEINDGTVRVAARVRHGILSGVAHIELQVYSTETNTVTVVVRRAALGSLPLPLQDLIENLKKIATQIQWDVRQMQSAGLPTLVITIPKTLDEKGRELEVTNIHISEGQVELSGRVKSRT